jgi:hypothetical protein
MLRFVQIRNNHYENRLIFLLLANKNIGIRKKNKNRPILRGKIVLMILFIRSHFVIDRSCTTIKLHISSLHFVQIRNNRYENRLIFFTVGEYEYCISINKLLYYVRDVLLSFV